MSPESGAARSTDHGARVERCRLYLITPPALEPAAFAGVLADALDGGDVACVQLRLDTADDAALRAAADALAPLCRERDVAFLVSGRADIAAQAGADGVHLGNAAAIPEARRLLGADSIAGVSCGGSRHAGMRAAEAGADSVSFGAFHPATTKPDAALVSPDVLSWWSGLMAAPCVAVGGITAANGAALVAAGANFLAVSGAVWRGSGGPARAVAALNATIESARPS